MTRPMQVARLSSVNTRCLLPTTRVKWFFRFGTLWVESTMAPTGFVRVAERQLANCACRHSLGRPYAWHARLLKNASSSPKLGLRRVVR